MKKILTSMIILSCLSVPAFAQHRKHAANNCPAKTCTDHRYDQAYSAPTGGGTMENDQDMAVKKDCPAATCTDHSFDRAYSAGNGAMRRTSSRQEQAMSIPAIDRNNVWTPAPTQMRDNSYSMNDYTYYGRQYKSNPDPYQGDDAPSYDGPAKNAYRNMRANNESEPLPANNGK